MRHRRLVRRLHLWHWAITYTKGLDRSVDPVWICRAWRSKGGPQDRRQAQL